MASGAEPTYHRYETPTQPVTAAYEQRRTSEIWGRIPRWGSEPVVEAYTGPLPDGQDGIEFTVPLPPEPLAPPGLALWRPPRVRKRVVADTEYAVLEGVTITKIVHGGLMV
jgi:hypothetical protein